MKKFFTYKVFAKPFDPEFLSGIFWDFDITGLLEDDDHISVFTSENSADTEVQFNNTLNKLKFYDFTMFSLKLFYFILIILSNSVKGSAL